MQKKDEQLYLSQKIIISYYEDLLIKHIKLDQYRQNVLKFSIFNSIGK